METWEIKRTAGLGEERGGGGAEIQLETDVSGFKKIRLGQ